MSSPVNQSSSNPWYAGNGEDQGYISVWL
jgi:hypothetical protein